MSLIKKRCCVYFLTVSTSSINQNTDEFHVFLNPVYTSALACFLFFQGRFSINLSGTGFKVAEATSWVSQGNYAVADIQKSQVRTVALQPSSNKPLQQGGGKIQIFLTTLLCPQGGSRVSGTCGGYCGKCAPSSDSILPVTVEHV